MSFAFAGDDDEATRAASGSRVETDPDNVDVFARAEKYRNRPRCVVQLEGG